jgi:F-type H+-transporting ATPase subunit b
MHLDGWTIALQTVNFGILVWLLNRFLYRPVLAVIDARKAEVQRQYDGAKAADDKAKTDLAAIETQRAAIAAERETALQKAQTEAQDAAAARRAQAERDAQALLDAGRKTLAEERERALDEARRLALDLGAAFAGRLLADVPLALRAEAWIERIERHIAALPRAERDALAGQLGGDAALSVVTAAALPEGTREAWCERLRRLLGSAISPSFAVDPALVAGAELHFPAAILRFSLRSALEQARAEIVGHDDAR